MKILHLASFDGNYGDMLSHSGHYRMLFSLNKKIEIQKLELRKFYQNARYSALAFDNEMARYFNEFDMVIIGGGGFLSQTFDTRTGTTFDFDIDFLKKVKSKVLFSSIGGVLPPSNTMKLYNDRLMELVNWIDQLEHVNLIIRNDGTKENLITIGMPDKLVSNIDSMLDAGFQASLRTGNSKQYAVINLGVDQIRRYVNDEHDYLRKLACWIQDVLILRCKLEIWFVPHIAADLQVISKVISSISDDLIRYNIRVSEVFPNQKGLAKLRSLYRNARLICAGRYHSHVAGMLSGNPCLYSYRFPRAASLYDSLDAPEPLSCLDLNDLDINFISNSFDIDSLRRTIFVDSKNWKRKFIELSEWKRNG